MAKHFEMSNHSLGLLERIINNISASPEVAYCYTILMTCPVLDNAEGKVCEYLVILLSMEKSR